MRRLSDLGAYGITFHVADNALLIPDLIGFWLTGTMVTERTNASTTGLLDVRTQDWDRDLCGRLGVRPGLFPGLVDAGTAIGPVRPEVGSWIGATGLTVTTVGSHDTASAVVGVPFFGDDAAYISCGTWGLVGVELEKPVVTAAGRAANFTNEAGVDGRTRFLTHVMGTWLLSETVRGWEAAGERIDLVALLRAAQDDEGPITVFDVQDPRFVPPGDMPSRIAAYCAERDLAPPVDRLTLVRSIVHSLAAGFARAVEQAATLSGRRCRAIHLVGAGRRTRCCAKRSPTAANDSSSPGPSRPQLSATSWSRPGPWVPSMAISSRSAHLRSCHGAPCSVMRGRLTVVRVPLNEGVAGSR